MEFLDYNGKPYKVILSDYIPKHNETRPRSSLHKRARAILKELFPCATILEEVNIGHRENLFFDFLLCQYNLAVECQGEQHYKFNSFMHGSSKTFRSSRRRDRNKEEWTKYNNFILVQLPYNESDDEWKKQILSSIIR
jgi:hypothetical protein